MTYAWLVENFTEDGESTGLYMLCQVNMTVTADVNLARRFRLQRTAEFRAEDMRKARLGWWRAVEHGFEDSKTPNAEAERVVSRPSPARKDIAMNEEWSQIAANAVAHAAQMAQASWQEAAASHQRPSAVFRPRLSVDGNQWCALYGDNLQDGVAGFGDSPAEAMWDFDRNWEQKLPAQEANSRADDVLRAHGFPDLRAG